MSDSATFDNARVSHYWGYDTRSNDDVNSRSMGENKIQTRFKIVLYHNSNLIEPWDGPKNVFTDGKKIGAILDRNGLRPSRHLVTDDGMIMLSSEMGVLDVPPEKVVKRWRLQPGKIFLVDLQKKDSRK